MHEFSIAESILSVIEENIGEKREIVSTTLTIGPLSGVNADASDLSHTLEPDRVLKVNVAGQESPVKWTITFKREA